MPKFLRAVTENWKLKLLAIALAVLLWVVVSAEQVTSNWIPVPLRVQVADPSYRLIESSAPQEVEVRFTGPGRDFLDLAIRRSPLVLTIDAVRDTQEVFNLEPGMVQVPNQLSVNAQDVRPGRITLRFTRLESRTVPVEVRVRNELGSDWTLVDSLRVEPSTVRLRAPGSRLANLRSVRTEPITLSPGDSAFSRLVDLDTSQLQGVEVSAEQVRVSGVVDEVQEVTYRDVPISLGRGLEIRPRTVDVTLRGAEQIVRAIDPQTFRVVVAIDTIPGRIPAEGLAVPLRVEGIPAGVVAEPSPRTVRLLPVTADEEQAPGDAPPADTLAVRGSRGPGA